MGDPVNFVDPSGLYDYNGIDWTDNKGKYTSWYNPYIALPQNALLKLHGGLYSNENAYTVIEHGFKGWSDINYHLQEIAESAKASGKSYIELSVCEIGQGNTPQKLHELSGLPIKYSEDYSYPPAFGIGTPTLSNSPTAKKHGWQWIGSL